MIWKSKGNCSTRLIDNSVVPIKSIELVKGQRESYTAGMDSCVTEVQLRELEWKTKTRGLLKCIVTFFRVVELQVHNW